MNNDFYFKQLVGSALTDIGRAADMLWLTFDNHIAIDIQTDTSLFLDSQLVTKASDVYQETGLLDVGGKRPQTLYDVKVAKLFRLGKVFRLLEISLTSELGLTMIFTSGLEIRVLPYPGMLADDEMWRIFKKNSDAPHMVAYAGNGIEWHGL